MKRASPASGIHGILDQIVGTGQRRQSALAAPHSLGQHNSEDGRSETAVPASGRTSVRRGRPPRENASDSTIREKVTLRIAVALLAQYREWTWEVRLPLSTLVEQAMQAHMAHSRRSIPTPP